MASTADVSEAAILVSSRQTRFHIQKSDYRELDVHDLDIRVVSSPGEKGSGSKAKGRAKSKGQGIGPEILCGASLKFKAGRRYALLGRNGAGKSTLLRAISEKLIPDIQEETRITALQQTDAKDVASRSTQTSFSDAVDRTVLEEVIERATARDEIQSEILELSNSAKDATDPVGTVRAYRKITHKRLQKKLFLLDRQARLRSGTRGLAARKALRAFEKEVAESQAHLEQADKEISDEVASTEVEEALNMLAELQIQVEPTRMAEVESKAKKILVGLGFSYSDMERRASTLSGGWTMRMELASCLMEETDILILDEPTNYLDLLGIMWLQQHLVSLSDLDEPPTLIMVSHDRTFLTNSTTDLIILKNKSLTYFHGSLEAYEEGQAEKRLHMTRMKEAQSKQKAHIQDTISKARQQAKQSGDDNKLRQAKSRQKKLDERWGLEASARGGRFKLNRDLAGYYTTMRAEIEVEAAERPVSLVLPEPPDLRFPGALISLENVEFKYPGVKSMSNKSGPTLEKASLTVHMGDRIGILGLNGAGKSTLVRLLANQAHPTSGTATWHPLLRLGYYSQGAVQSLQALAYSTPPDQSPVTALSILTQEAGLSLTEQEIRGLLGSLGLPGRVASDVPVQKLSGGQMVRLELARVLWRRPQVLVLDEVTTHLDYETVRAMRSALRRWRGAVVLVSHDRWFVRGVIEGERDDSGGGDRELDGNSQSEDEDADEEGVPRRRVMYRLCRGVLNVLEGGVNEFEGIVNKKVRRMGIGEKKGGGAGDLRCR